MPRSRKKPLTRDRILQAAMKLADANGIDALSMRKLGKAVGVEAMSLYNHVSNKDDVLDGLVDLFIGELELPAADDGWKPAMREYALAMRAALRRHPWAASVLESRTATSETRMRHHDGMIGRLRQSGFSIQLAQKAYLTLDSYIYGFALQESAWPLDEPEIPNAIASMDVDPKDYPYLTEMMAYAAETASADPNAASELLTFEFGLDLILDGLERLVDPS